MSDWVRAGRALRWTKSAKHDARPPAADVLLSGKTEDGSWMAAPLSDASGHNGFMVMYAALASGSYEAKHESVAERLRDPLAAAMRNDLRLREMCALRNAAEAEKSAALRRLGREKLSSDIVGAAGGLHAVMQRVSMVAQADVPVLIFGETGTGKEVIARAIHEHSPRAQGPFVRVNSGAIPAELVDSELFGHEKGAFTGADARRQGWFERADGGTLLLDEIGELSLPAQVRLLRALQDGEIQRVGGHRIVHVNVRVVAATHRDLPGMIQSGSFREDLWYRLNVFPIVLPPLRERQADLFALTTHFCERAARRFGFRVLYPDTQDIASIAAYDWPGNIRELASVIDRAVILGEGERLEIRRALGSGHKRFSGKGRPPLHADMPPETPGKKEFQTLDDTLRCHIESALRTSFGRIEGPSGAATLLDINPHTLRAKMRKLGIDWKRFRKNAG